MNNFMNKVSRYFGRKDLTSYPELCYKQTADISYTIAIASSAVLYDIPSDRRTPDWKLI